MYGEVLEWLNRTHSKCVIRGFLNRGFESHPLRIVVKIFLRKCLCTLKGVVLNFSQ